MALAWPYLRLTLALPWPQPLNRPYPGQALFWPCSGPCTVQFPGPVLNLDLDLHAALDLDLHLDWPGTVLALPSHSPARAVPDLAPAISQTCPNAIQPWLSSAPTLAVAWLALAWDRLGTGLGHGWGWVRARTRTGEESGQSRVRAGPVPGWSRARIGLGCIRVGLEHGPRLGQG